VVLKDAGILGYLGGDEFDATLETPVNQVMEPGPSTIRPHGALAETGEDMQERDIDRILVTTADGQFLGTPYCQKAEQMLGGMPPETG